MPPASAHPTMPGPNARSDLCMPGDPLGLLPIGASCPGTWEAQGPGRAREKMWDMLAGTEGGQAGAPLQAGPVLPRNSIVVCLESGAEGRAGVAQPGVRTSVQSQMASSLGQH